VATRREEARRIGRGGGLGARPAQSRGGSAGAGAWARGRRGRAVAQPHPRGLRRRLSSNPAEGGARAGGRRSVEELLSGPLLNGSRPELIRNRMVQIVPRPDPMVAD